MGKIIIQEPMLRTCNFEGHNRFRLPLPWVIYSYTSYNDQYIEDVRMGFCSEEPNEKSTIYFPFLPNVFGEFSACLENSSITERPAINPAIQYFWSTPFSYSYDWAGVLYLNSILDGPADKLISLVDLYTKWSKMTWQNLMLKADVAKHSSKTTTIGRILTTNYTAFKNMNRN